MVMSQFTKKIKNKFDHNTAADLAFTSASS